MKKIMRSHYHLSSSLTYNNAGNTGIEKCLYIFFVIKFINWREKIINTYKTVEVLMFPIFIARV